MKQYNYTRTGQRYPDSLLEACAALQQLDKHTLQYETAQQQYKTDYQAYLATILAQYPGATRIGYDYYTDGKTGHELVIIA